jgi:hypothetical protein
MSHQLSYLKPREELEQPALHRARKRRSPWWGGEEQAERGKKPQWGRPQAEPWPPDLLHRRISSGRGRGGAPCLCRRGRRADGRTACCVATSRGEGKGRSTQMQGRGWSARGFGRQGRQRWRTADWSRAGKQVDDARGVTQQESGLVGRFFGPTNFG